MKNLQNWELKNEKTEPFFFEKLVFLEDRLCRGKCITKDTAVLRNFLATELQKIDQNYSNNFDEDTLNFSFDKF